MKDFSVLTRHLQAQSAYLVPMSFAEIEGVLGETLPRSADAYRAWWSNNPSNNPLTKAWLDAGFKSEQVDLVGRKVVFRRTTGSPGASRRGFEEAAAAYDAGSTRPKLFGWLSGSVSVAAGVDLASPADPDWGHRIDAE